jgi:hypothetical protein
MYICSVWMDDWIDDGMDDDPTDLGVASFHPPKTFHI